MANKAGGASLNPADFTSGGMVGDGRYTIKDAKAVMFDYGGTTTAVPAVEITYLPHEGGEPISQHYSAGKAEFLEPSDDGTELVHPNGEDAKLAKSSNFGTFVAAIVKAGFPPTELGSKVTCFVGADVEIVQQAQPTRAGSSNKDKTIPLPTKYYGKVAGGKAAKGASKPAAAAAASNGGGSVDDATVERIKAVLAGEEDKTLGRVKLATKVWLTAQKAKDPNAAAYKKLAGDVKWLEDHADEGEWVLDSDTDSVVAA